MSLSDRFTSRLLDSLDEQSLVQVMKDMIPGFCGYKVTDVTFKDNVMTVMGEGSASPTTLLVYNLTTGIATYGRAGHCGLTPVDLTIIKNIVQG